MTEGGIMRGMVVFAMPLMLGNILQQFYNLADTFIVGRFIGAGALAAVGAAYALMVFINSVQLGLCMGSGTLFSLHFGAGRMDRLRHGVYVSFVFIGLITVALNVAVFLLIDPLMRLLQVPDDVYGMMREYLLVVFCGIGFSFIYNFFASLLRAVGNSVVPLVALVVSVVLNVVLDIVFVCVFGWGVAGAAWATVISQGVSAAWLTLYTMRRMAELLPGRKERRFSRSVLGEIGSYSLLTCLQQSVMNFGILMVQGLVNSFGTAVIAAFAAAVKIDTLAYMPAQDFGNAYSVFVAQNYGASKVDRVHRGTRGAFALVTAFCLAVSVLVFIFAEPLMGVFVGDEPEIVRIGSGYLRIEGAFYCGIGILFLLYGYYRAVRRPAFSVVLTVISLGTRVAFAYALSAIPAVGVAGIWWSVPIGWALADAVGLIYYRKINRLHNDIAL